MKIQFDTILLKRRTLRFFFAVEILVFAAFYFFGSTGIQQLMSLQYEQSHLDQKIFQVQQEVALLNDEIDQWEKTSFLKEKVAREQLQMAREGDEIYYLG